MDTPSITVQGIVNADGLLELHQPVPLPPGPVQVTLTPVAERKEDTWAVLQRIWAEQLTSGEQGRTKEEIDAELQELRDELEDRAISIEQLQDEAGRAHE